MVINLWICCCRSLSIHRIHCQRSPSSIVVTSKIPISGGGEREEDHVSSEDDDGAHANATADGAIETEIEKKRLLPFQTAAWFISPFKFCLKSQLEFPRKQCVANSISASEILIPAKNHCF